MNHVVMVGHVCPDLTPQTQHLTLEPGRLEVGPLDITLGASVTNTGRALGVDVSFVARAFLTRREEVL